MIWKYKKGGKSTPKIWANQGQVTYDRPLKKTQKELITSLKSNLKCLSKCTAPYKTKTEISLRIEINLFTYEKFNFFHNPTIRFYKQMYL